jgi:uncharacterized SAM-binding protein YcdF (DUF218 family)
MKILRHMSHATLFLLALLLLWLGGYLAFAGWVASMKPDDAARPTDAVIVLTGGARRIATGLDLLADKKAPQLYISGVNEAVSLRGVLAQWQSDTAEKNAASCCIVLDHNARNTIQNASETSDWVKRENIHSLRLVTSAYHMPRAWLEFRHALPDVEIVPYPVVFLKTDLESGRFWVLTFVEYHKTLLTLLRTRVSPFNLKGNV